MPFFGLGCWSRTHKRFQNVWVTTKWLLRLKIVSSDTINRPKYQIKLKISSYYHYHTSLSLTSWIDRVNLIKRANKQNVITIYTWGSGDRSLHMPLMSDTLNSAIEEKGFLSSHFVFWPYTPNSGQANHWTGQLPVMGNPPGFSWAVYTCCSLSSGYCKAPIHGFCPLTES